jgi:GTP-binding protein
VDVKSFRGWVDAQFVISAARPEQFPAESLPEIAFLGRSNVGKSSLLNCLAGQKKLAFTSAKPGCTQLVNFYRIGGQFHFVDLPGYGYARVPKDIVFQWKQLIEQYLLHRRSLQLCFLILDARRGWMEKDLELKRWLELHNRRYLVIATKTDKLKSQSDQRQGIAAIRSQFPETEPLPFSAVSCRGAREIWQAITNLKTQRQ